MLAFEKFNQTIGTENSAHLIIAIANIIWSFGLMFGAETYYAGSFYIAMCRGFCTVTLAYAISKLYGYPLDFRHWGDFKICFVRCLITSFQQVLISYGFRYLQPSIVYTITNIGPVLVFILDYFKNNITVTRRQVVGIIIAVVGLIIAVNSLFLMNWLGYGNYVDESKYQYQDSTPLFKVFLCLVLFTEHIFWAWAVLLTKDLKQTNALQLNYFQGVFFVLFNGVLYLLSPNTMVIGPVEFLKDIFFIGFLLSFATFMYTTSLIMSKNSGSLTILNFITVIFGYVISIVKYGQSVNPFGISGSLLILVGLFLVLIKKTNSPKN